MSQVVATTISQLPPVPNPITGAEFTPIVQVISGVPETYRATLSQIVAIASGGVSSVNSLTGAINITAGSNITVTPSGSNIIISSSAGSNISQGSFSIIG